MKRVLLTLGFILSGFLCSAQEIELEPSDQPVLASVLETAHIRQHPAGPVVGVLPQGASVEIIGESAGWIRARSVERKGWIDRRYLQTTLRVPMVLEARQPACAEDLSACPRWGCADKDSPRGLLNLKKHGPPTGSPLRVSLQGFATLQTRADALVGQVATLDKADRDNLRARLGEGRRVAASGYLIGEPHPNTGETVNCNLTEAANNDIHLSIGPRPRASEDEGIVAEMIPQQRHANWTIQRLRKLRGRQVLVVGQLFYDNVHRVNRNPRRPQAGQPKRFSLWEVHPITAIYACKQQRCDATVRSQWVEIEDLPD
jgi:hypothetical protein